MSFNKKDLNEKFISFLDQIKDEPPKSVAHLNDRVLVIDGLNTFIRAFAVNPSYYSSSTASSVSVTSSIPNSFESYLRIQASQILS